MEGDFSQAIDDFGIPTGGKPHFGNVFYTKYVS